jgi:hypothetical protein
MPYLSTHPRKLTSSECILLFLKSLLNVHQVKSTTILKRLENKLLIGKTPKNIKD